MPFAIRRVSPVIRHNRDFRAGTAKRITADGALPRNFSFALLPLPAVPAIPGDRQ